MQKSAYEMRISDWSSDVCSSDLIPVVCSFHDYYSICPTVNLIDDQGRYHPHGVTEHGENALWPGDPSATPTTADFLGYWQRRMQQALSAADAFVASSNSARQILADALPGIAARDRKSVVPGKSVSVRVDLGGRSI